MSELLRERQTFLKKTNVISLIETQINHVTTTPVTSVNINLVLKSELLHELSVLIGRSRRESGRSRLRKSVVFLTHWSCGHLHILQKKHH